MITRGRRARYARLGAACALVLALGGLWPGAGPSRVAAAPTQVGFEEWLIGVGGNLVASALYDGAKTNPEFASLFSPSEDKASARFDRSGAEVHADVGDVFQLDVALDFANRHPLAAELLAYPLYGTTTRWYSYWWEVDLNGEPVFNKQISHTIMNRDGRLGKPIKKSVYFLAASNGTFAADCSAVGQTTVTVKAYVKMEIRERNAHQLIETRHLADDQDTVVVNVHNPWSVEITQYPQFPQFLPGQFSANHFGHHTPAGSAQMKYVLRHKTSNFGTHVGDAPSTLFFDSRADVQAPPQASHFKFHDRDQVSPPSRDPNAPPQPLALADQREFTQPLDFLPTVMHHNPPTSDIPVQFSFGGVVYGERSPSADGTAPAQSWFAYPQIAGACPPAFWSVVDQDVQPTPSPGTTTSTQ